MAIEREGPYLAVICDGCGDRFLPDLEPDAEEREIAAAMKEIGWKHERPDRHPFPTAFARNVHVYEQDFCGDCQSDEPRPKPLIRSGPVRPHTPIDAFANDPCDEWPRALVFKAAGLRPACGHPPGPELSECGYCRSGCPAGDTRPAWRRA